MEEFLGKKYKLTHSENFDEFMKAVGMGLMLRKIVGFVSPVIELTKDGDVYTLTSTSTFKTMVTTFKLGEEFDSVKPDGTVMKCVSTIEGNKLIQVEKGNKKEVHVVREFFANELRMVMTIDDIVCKRVHTLVED